MTHLTDRAFAGLPTGTGKVTTRDSSPRFHHPDTEKATISGSEAMRGLTELIEKIAHRAHNTTHN